MRNRWQNTEKPKTNEDKKPMRTYNYKSEKKKPKKKNKKKKKNYEPAQYQSQRAE
jgi:hypothetical protein